MKRGATLIIVVFALIGCSSENKNYVSNLDKITETDGFFDLPFTIVDQTSSDGYLVNRIQAVSQNDTLELLVSLKEGIPPGFVNGVPKNMFLEEGIMFKSTGIKSNMLLNTLAEKYDISGGRLTMKEEQTFTCANLNQEPIDYKSGVARFKIFMEDETQNAELFVNFDFNNSTISLNEKDPEYRSSLIDLMKK